LTYSHVGLNAHIRHVTGKSQDIQVGRVKVHSVTAHANCGILLLF